MVEIRANPYSSNPGARDCPGAEANCDRIGRALSCNQSGAEQSYVSIATKRRFKHYSSSEFHQLPGGSSHDGAPPR
jgi:hypothetical protein